MSDKNNNGGIDTQSWTEPGTKNAQLVYILYFTSFFLGLTAIIGLVMAYINRGKAGATVDSHYTWLIRTFWIGVVYSLISAVLMVIGIGFLLFIAIAIWAIIRLVKGIQSLGRNEAIADTQTWWI